MKGMRELTDTIIKTAKGVSGPARKGISFRGASRVNVDKSRRALGVKDNSDGSKEITDYMKKKGIPIIDAKDNWK